MAGGGGGSNGSDCDQPTTFLGRGGVRWTPRGHGILNKDCSISKGAAAAVAAAAVAVVKPRAQREEHVRMSGGGWHTKAWCPGGGAATH